MADIDYIGKDKLQHFLACTFISILHPYLAIGAALGKEYGDYKNPNSHWCIWDLVADFVGVALGYGIHILVVKWIG